MAVFPCGVSPGTARASLRTSGRVLPGARRTSTLRRGGAKRPGAARTPNTGSRPASRRAGAHEGCVSDYRYTDRQAVRRLCLRRSGRLVTLERVRGYQARRQRRTQDAAGRARAGLLPRTLPVRAAGKSCAAHGRQCGAGPRRPLVRGPRPGGPAARMASPVSRPSRRWPSTSTASGCCCGTRHS